MTALSDGGSNCLVIMPFGLDPKDKLLSQLVYESVIRPACTDGGATGIRVDMIPLGDRPIREELFEDIRTAPLVLADITGNNPNVLFELGMRASHGKPFVLISMNPEKAAFSASGFQIINYATSDAKRRIADAVKSALVISARRTHRDSALYELAEISKRNKAFDNPFQDRLAAWRIARATQDVEGIEGHEWTLESRSSENYIAYMFTQIMNMLEMGDEYSTVTNMDFWRDSSVQESFLKANIDAAARGVLIRRVFLINHDDWVSRAKASELREVVQQHVKASNVIEKQGAGHLLTRYRLTKDYAADYAKFRHFGLARRRHIDLEQSGSMLLEPNYRSKAPGDNIHRISISFPKVGNDAYLRLQKILPEFDNLFEHCPDLSTLITSRSRRHAA